MQKTNIAPEILQEMLASATNASEKGQSQFFTPRPVAAKLAEALPPHRPVILDWNCGRADLLQASVNATTLSLLAADIEGAKPVKDAPVTDLRLARIQYDCTLAYPLMVDLAFTFDLGVFNPPWRLFWHRERLARLADSASAAVRLGFAGVEDQAPRGTIDSTPATILMALDRCSLYGEFYVIANHNTLERLVFGAGAPHNAVAKHCWARLLIPGNPMTGLEHCKWHDKEGSDGRAATSGSSQRDEPHPTQEFITEVVFFARDHERGPRSVKWPELPDRAWRMGAEVRGFHTATEDTAEVWHALREHIGELHGNKVKVPWNLWLAGGRIHTALSRFQEKSTKTDKAEAKRLFALADKSPMELVLQRAQRDELLHVAREGGWRVQPELIAAVEEAIRSYHAKRAPLYPLPGLQRLGYLDEQDTIECTADLVWQGAGSKEQGKPGQKSDPAPCSPLLAFRAGEKYALRTQTVKVERRGARANAYTGTPEELEFTGHELAFYIGPLPQSLAPASPGNGKRLKLDREVIGALKQVTVDGSHTKMLPLERSLYLRVDRALNALGGYWNTQFEAHVWSGDPTAVIEDAIVTGHVTEAKAGKPPPEYCFMDGKLRDDDKTTLPGEMVIHFTLQDLVNSFSIPDVPDVATVNPEAYEKNLATLADLEQLTTALTA